MRVWLRGPATGRFRAVEITDAQVGEGYARHGVEAGDVILGDRGYAHARGIASVYHRGGHVVARANPHTIRLCTREREVFNPLLEGELVPKTGVRTWDVHIPIPPPNPTRSHKTWPLGKAAGRKRPIQRVPSWLSDSNTILS